MDLFERVAERGWNMSYLLSAGLLTSHMATKAIAVPCWKQQSGASSEFSMWLIGAQTHYLSFPVSHRPLAESRIISGATDIDIMSCGKLVLNQWTHTLHNHNTGHSGKVIMFYYLDSSVFFSPLLGTVSGKKESPQDNLFRVTVKFC